MVGLQQQQQQQQHHQQVLSSLANNLAKSSHNLALDSAHYWDNLIKHGENALEAKDYLSAKRFFSECIELASKNLDNAKYKFYLKDNFRVYTLRAEANFHLHNYKDAYEDSIIAREFNPKWAQAYYLQGQSQLLQDEHADCLAIFAFGLAQDPTSKLLFDAFVDVFRKLFEDKFNKLKALELDRKPFVVVSTLGQELLARDSAEHAGHAAIILESALKMVAPGESKKFKTSVLSTISYAYCLRKEYDRAVSHMKKEFDIESELEDVTAQCRVLSNLGYTYYKMRKYDKSIDAHRKQVNLAMRSQLFQQASQALNAMGHVHVARNDYTSALTSHSRCLEILKQLGDNEFAQYKELLSIGHIHSMLNDIKSAEERYNEARILLDSCAAQSKICQEEFNTGMVMVNFNLAYLALKSQSFTAAHTYYKQVLELSERIRNSRRADYYKMRAFNGLGQTFRLFKDFDNAKVFFECQLKCARQLRDGVGLSQALSNLGMIYQHFKNYKSAESLFLENFALVDEMRDPLLKAYAYSYLASMSFIFNRYSDAKEKYENSLELFRELDYCSAEQKTIDLNMAAVHERMGHPIGGAGAVGTTSAQTSGNELNSSSTGTTSNTHNNQLHAQTHKKILMA